MKATGVVRKLSALGHLVLPVDLRRSLEIDAKDTVEMFLDEDLLILKKYEPLCFLCKSKTNVKIFNRRLICCKCIENIRALFI